MRLFGVALILISASYLIPAILMGEIPKNCSIKPLTRELNPLEFRITFCFLALEGLIGVALLAWDALKYLKAPL